MRFKAADIGLLVRPKTITHLFLWTKESNIDEWWKQVLFQYRWRSYEKKQQLLGYYKTDLPNLFQNLHLGDVNKSTEHAYVCEIISFIILHKGSLYHVDSKEKAESFEKEIKKRFGQNAYLPVVAVGLKFYKGFKIEENGFSLGEPWEHTNKDNAIWFYQPKEIVPISNVLSFESLYPGQLVAMKRIDGIVLYVKELSKPQFYSANSCVSKTVTLLSTNINYIRLIPEKRFRIIR